MMAIDALLQRAFHSVPAMEANAAMAELRLERGGEGAPALSYEAVIPAEASLEDAATRILPRLVYFLDCRGAPLPRAPGVFMSLFSGDSLYFLEVHDVIEVLGGAAGWSVPELISRFGAASTDPS